MVGRWVWCCRLPNERFPFGKLGWRGQLRARGWESCVDHWEAMAQMNQWKITSFPRQRGQYLVAVSQYLRLRTIACFKKKSRG